MDYFHTSDLTRDLLYMTHIATKSMFNLPRLSSHFLTYSITGTTYNNKCRHLLPVASALPLSPLCPLDRGPLMPAFKRRIDH